MATKKKTTPTKKTAAKKTVSKKSAPKKKAVKKKAAKKKAAPLPASEEPAKLTGPVDEISVRMYCHGFGDCFLITFFSNNKPEYRMLIDCGMLTGDTDTLKQAIANISEECENHLDLVVQTHQHKDHISGFNLRGADKQLLWDAIEVDNVWLAWTENTAPGGDKLAIDLKEKFQKKKTALARSLKLYNQQIESDGHRQMIEKQFKGDDYYSSQQRYASMLQQMLNFYDIGPEQVDRSLKMSGNELGLTMEDAMNYFVKRNKANAEGAPHISFWNPGDFANGETTGINGVNFYFLGPPKDYELLKKMDDHEHTEMYMSGVALSDNFYLAVNDASKEDCPTLSPFHEKYGWKKTDIERKDLKDNKDHVWNLYHDSENAWRSVGADWLQNAGILALHLDSYTNNTSLVFAMEFEGSGKVLLFAADAQIGNWISWTESEKGSASPKLKWQAGKDGKQVTAKDLLNRTVFYKVGHHGSHNATAKKHGLELMNSKELTAMIPVDEEVAKNQGKRGWKMPADDLYERLLERTCGRIIRADIGNLLKKNVEDIPKGARPTQQQRQQFNNSVSESEIIITTDDGRRRPLYWEYKIKG